MGHAVLDCQAMDSNVLIRPEQRADSAAIAEVNRLAFNGDAEARLVAALRESEAFIPELSLVAVAGGALVGHLLLTRVVVRNASRMAPALALAPMAVHPHFQRMGIGSQLVIDALAAARRLGHDLVIVLGHANFYPRFGFVPASRHSVRPPFEVRDEIFMLAWLGSGQIPDIAGVVEYPPAFDGV